ncbi:hypothetical protein AJ78_05415 [Emergomyces pasteurianus Ep9510]|uniref:Uncharacterized protein n=1 Tax=Emergomyces pasteurianus Ep9510 TaxID=1447872 RepID=A0A1J9QGC6_9EURO|nr:hypothetical protein AJ78_05415 [Emergomyces pasteurianus Ep9510]
MISHELELKSPHLLEHDAEFWIEFIKRDVPGFDELVLPENPDSWYDVYHELLEKTAREVDKDAERMKLALLGLDSKKAKHSSRVVDTKKMRLPREKPTAIQRHAFLDRKMGGISPIFVPTTKQAGGRGLTPFDQTPRWKLEAPKIPRPAAKKSALPFVKRNQRLCIPTHRLINSASQIVNAPRSLIEDYKRPIEQNIPRPKTRDPRSSSTTETNIGLSISPCSRDPGSKKPKLLISSSPTSPSRTSSISRMNSLITKKEEEGSVSVTTSPRADRMIHGSDPGHRHTSATKSLQNSTKPNLSRLSVRKRPVSESVLVHPKRRQLF